MVGFFIIFLCVCSNESKVLFNFGLLMILILRPWIDYGRFSCFCSTSLNIWTILQTWSRRNIFVPPIKIVGSWIITVYWSLPLLLFQGILRYSKTYITPSMKFSVSSFPPPTLKKVCTLIIRFKWCFIY